MIAPMVPTTPLPRNPMVYEINARIWVRELAQRQHQPVHFDTVPDSELDRIAELGFHAVWLMGVWSTGAQSREIARAHAGLKQEFQATLPDYTLEDCVGSPYAITEYVVAANLGGPAALARLRERLAQRGLRVLLDFVSNRLHSHRSSVA